MALRHESAANVLQELVAAATCRLGFHSRKCVLRLRVAFCGPVLPQAHLEVALGLAVQTLELLLVEAVEKRAGKKSQLVAGMLA